MPIPDRNNHPEVKRTEQSILNWGFDETFNVPMVELVAWDRTNNVLRRVELVESTDTPGVYGMVIVNADGSAVSGGGGSTPSNYGSGAYGTDTYD